MGKDYVLRADRGSESGREFEIQEGNNLLGRWDPESGSFPEIDLEDLDREVKVSRRHALLVKQGTSFKLEDLGSTNGTYLNRTQKLEPGIQYAIEPGDEIIAGKIFLTLAEK